jgi:nucleoside-diphosphate-sugar epimerase
MRIVVTGASGNVGTSVVEELVSTAGVDEVVGVCRRPHDWRPERTRWIWADLGDPGDLELGEVVAGADVVVHLAWLFQPTRRPEVTWRANVLGTRRLLDAVTAAGVPGLVVASSVGAYSPRADLEPVTEAWPTHGVPEAAYSREKAYVERMLDDLEARNPDVRVVRMRPAFTFRSRASVQQRRLFLGPLVPHALIRRGRIPVLPLPADLRLQLVHSEDVARAYVAAATGTTQGAFNLTTDEVLDPAALAEILGARWARTPAGALRSGLSAAYRARTTPAAPELFDLVMQAPMMSAARAHDELGWRPRYSAAEALGTFLHGIRNHAGPHTPPLDPATSGPGRAHEYATGVGASAG